MITRKTICVENIFLLKYCFLMSMCNINFILTVEINLLSTVDITKTHFGPMVDGQMMSIVDSILMLIQNILYTGYAGGTMSVLCLVLIIYFCLSIRAIVEVKHSIRI